jgi:hypothetical protein
VRKLFATRWWIAIAVITAALVLAGGRAAYAYFTSSGSGTGAASVGSAGASDWGVTEDTGESTIGAIYPGSGNDQIVFSVENDGSGDQQFSTATATVDHDDSGNIETADGPVTGCLASWFDAAVTNDPRINTDVNSGGSVQVTVKVTMPSDATDDQNACEGASPEVTLSIS